MPTSSFDKEFIVTDHDTIVDFKTGLEDPTVIVSSNKNIREESLKGASLLLQRLSEDNND